MDSKRIYVSDVHMGSGFVPKQGQTNFDWLPAEDASVFGQFLTQIASDPDLEEVVFVGDLMDTWVWPVDSIPPSFDQILSAPHNKPIVNAVKQLIAAKKTVVYLPGNHDMLADVETVSKHLNGVRFAAAGSRNPVFQASRVRAEHGSAYALFNAPDPAHHPARLPLGYFISRVTATAVRDTGKRIRHYITLADDLLEMLGPQKLPTSVFEAVLEEARLGEDTEIHMPKGAGPAVITAKQVKDRYADLYDQWKQSVGPGLAFKAIMAEIGWLEDLADRLTKKGGTNIVVFGHSHDWALDKDSLFVDDRIYANCGTWCDAEKPCTYVETRKANGAHVVRVVQWEKGGALKTLKQAEVAL